MKNNSDLEKVRIPVIARREVTRHLLRKFDIRASKRLGQNFLVDEAIVDEIVSSAGIQPDDNVLEIGPGLGTLTQKLAETGAQVIAVELDEKMVNILRTTVSEYDNVRIIHDDVLKLDMSGLFDGQPFKVVANLPYYITTPIVMTLLEKRLPVSEIVVMVQKEVAERFTAAPGGKEYGAVTVAVQYFAIAEIMFEVPPRSFIPEPEVTSAVLRLKIRTAAPVDLLSEKKFFWLVKAAFSQRRKTLANNMKAAGVSSGNIAAAAAAAGIDMQRRGETLSLQEYADLSNAIVQLSPSAQ